jgi:hypothetical protein
MVAVVVVVIVIVILIGKAMPFGHEQRDVDQVSVRNLARAYEPPSVREASIFTRETHCFAPRHRSR